MRILEGKVAVITGAARGIGKAIAVRFAENGADVAFSDIRMDEASLTLEKQLLEMGVRAKAYASDASSFEGSDAFVQEVLADFGKVDILVNNAGITRDNLLMRMSEQDWDLILNVNLKSAFNLTKAVLKPMMKQRFGSIINMSSVVGVSGNAGQANYAASKAGMIGFTKSVAQELGSRSIRCNAIAPGFIETEMTAHLPEEVRQGWMNDIPLKRGGKPEDVADACVFLGSDLSSYITGQVLNVCGGLNT
jgi:3-oxoacyl-[acyl-carrier protein] reductase